MESATAFEDGNAVPVEGFRDGVASMDPRQALENLLLDCGVSAKIVAEIIGHYSAEILPQSDTTCGIAPLVDSLLSGARDTGEVGARVVLLAYHMKLPCAPGSLRNLGGMLRCSHTAANNKLTRFLNAGGPFVRSGLARTP